MTAALPDNWPEIAWAKLPVELRRKAVTRLKTVYSPEFMAEVKALIDEKGLGEWLPAGWHFGQGMTVRNTLRCNEGLPHSVQGVPRIRDQELPALPEVYGRDAGTHGNWDDYYVQCLEAAAGARQVEDSPIWGNGIWASVSVILKNPADRGLANADSCPHKVRMTLFSGPDFRTAHINNGRLVSCREDGEAIADQLCSALALLGVPAERNGVEIQGGSILRDVPECGEYSPM